MKAKSFPTPSNGARPLKCMEFGAYELDGEIARGGMGVVYLARDPRLNRPIALKMIRSGALASEGEVERFRTEAEAAANLDHAHIVPIYEIGTADGFHYFTMKLLEGGHLGEMTAACTVRDAAWQRRAAQILAKIARAVHHAHQHGVLHRDIKPTNILLDENGEPHLTDFGLAKLLTSGSSLTLTTDVLGTPSYMAPEQAAGNARGATTAADIYSLGAVLYELLAGTPPFQGATAVEVLKHAQEKEVPALRTLNPAIAPDLETICLKCLEKDPARRFTTAEALADDLTRFLNDEPILAGRPSRIYRARKFLKRHRLATGALSVVSLCLLALVGGAGWVARDQAAREALARSQTESALTELASWLAQDNLPEAMSALKRAEGFSAPIPHDSLAARVRQWRADLALVEKLDAIQAESGRLTENGFDILTTSEAYAEALRPLGVSLDLAAEDRTARAQRLRASPIWRRLGDAIDDWSIWAKDSRAALRWAEEIDRDPERNEVRRAIADGDIATLIRLGKQAGQTPIPVRSALLLSRSLRQAGEIDTAAAVLRTCRIRYPDDFWLNRQWGYLLATALQDSAEAVAVTQATVALRPQSVIARLDLAMALLRVKRFAEAEQHLRETLRFAPNDPLILTNLASTLRMQRRLDEAWTVLQSALDHFPNSADAHFEAASLHQAGNNVEARLAELQEAVRLQPKSSRYRGWLGEFYLEQGKLTEAEAQFRETLQNDPQCLHACTKLRGIFLSQRRPDELDTLERVWIANNHPRNRKTPPELIDLSRHYNATLDAGWQDPKNETLHLGALPAGLQNLSGISFDIRGVIQLSGKNLDLQRQGFPNGIHGIAVGLLCKRIHFVHGNAWRAGDGETIAEYVIHRTDGTHETVPVIYGRHARDWLTYVGSPTEVSDAKVAWQSPLAAALKDRQTSLYGMAWENSAPSIPVASIDFVSQRGDAAPFLIAITIEP